MLAKEELVSVLEKCCEVLSSSAEKQLGSTTQKVKDFLTQFQNLDGKCKMLPILAGMTVFEPECH